MQNPPPPLPVLEHVGGPLKRPATLPMLPLQNLVFHQDPEK
jgi:hypothetical protein